jgi:hypothetical protein
MDEQTKSAILKFLNGLPLVDPLEPHSVHFYECEWLVHLLNQNHKLHSSQSFFVIQGNIMKPLSFSANVANVLVLLKYRQF